ncbi:MAG: gliding motility-associated C-terminal domain-containing protein [Flavobacteriales bacterium]|nr:gliding motility-associated C-terminal domain-containing protein [Flavobacteriales bacterium]
MKTHCTDAKRQCPALVLTVILATLMLAPAFGQLPVFEGLEEDHFGLGLDPHSEYLAIMFPTLVDIDNDGDLDLFIGENWEQDGASIRLLDFYRNEGDRHCPVFQLEGSYPFGIPDASIWGKFIDINGDGLPDLFAQKPPDPGLYCILNTGTVEAPFFESDNIINNLPFGLDGSGVSFLYTPVFTDFDGDGDYDVFATGRTGGHFLYQRNIGTSTEPNFMSPEADPFHLSLPYAPPNELIFPALADWDCDGDIDIISSVLSLNDHDDFDAYFHENKYDELGYIYFEDGVLLDPTFITTQGDLDGDGDLDALAFQYYNRNISSYCVTLPEAAFSAERTEANLEYVFTDASTAQATECNPVQWLWDFGDGTTSDLQNPWHDYEDPGTYTVNLTVYSVDGCDASSTPINVVIYESPVAGFEADTIVCSDLPITFTDLSTGDIDNWYYHFSDEDVTIEVDGDIEDEVIYTFDDAGFYVVTQLVTNRNGCSDSAKIFMEVRPHPVADFYPDSIALELPDTAMLFWNTSWHADDDTVHWNFDNGYHVYDTWDAEGIFQDSGLYNVSLTVFNQELGCVDSIIKPFYVWEQETFFIQTAFTPNGDGNNDVFEIKQKGIVDWHMQIFDRWGKLVWETYDVREFWDGTHRESGQPVQQGAYSYQIDLIWYKGRHYNKMGTITVIR